MNGLKWRGNSSYGGQEGLNKRGLNKWKEVLTHLEVDKINQITREINEIVGYSEDNSLTPINHNLDEFHASYLGIQVPLRVTDDCDRYKFESMRMSVLTQIIFNGSLMKNIGNRYQKKNIFSRLEKKIFSYFNKRFN